MPTWKWNISWSYLVGQRIQKTHLEPVTQISIKWVSWDSLSFSCSCDEHAYFQLYDGNIYTWRCNILVNKSYLTQYSGMCSSCSLEIGKICSFYSIITNIAFCWLWMPFMSIIVIGMLLRGCHGQMMTQCNQFIHARGSLWPQSHPSKMINKPTT